MNLLQRCIENNGYDETRAMNALQANAVISDLCVWAADVADSDCARAAEWLIANEEIL